MKPISVTSMFDSYTPTALCISEFAKYVQRLPQSWRMRFQQGRFIAVTPRRNYRLGAPHGYKVRFNFLPHRVDDAITALRITSDICGSFDIPFKFLPSLHLCQIACQKNYPVEGAGKLITLYIEESAVFDAVCSALNARISATSMAPAAYPISDMPVTDNISFRYGAYTAEPLLTGPDGSVFRDSRDVFLLPPWVELPPWVVSKIGGGLEDPDPEEVPIVSGGRYEILECVHRTFAGAIYDAVETNTGKRVCLKESRPHVDIGGAWATDRLVNEARVLGFLEHVKDLTPGVRDCLETDDGHRVLVMDAVVAENANELAPPLFHWWQSLGVVDDTLLLRVAAALISCIKDLHSRHVAWIDFSPMNVLVAAAEGLDLRMIDAEHAILDASLEDLRRDCQALGRFLIWLLGPDNAVILDPNIAIEDSDFQRVASKSIPAPYRRATLACLRKETSIYRISDSYIRF